MAHPLDDTKLKLKWADRQIDNVRREVETLVRSNPYRIALELDSETGEQVYKAYFSGAIPETMLEATGYAVSNLRSSLDYLMVAIARANGHTKVTDVHFPFAGSLKDFESKKTKDKIKRLPPRAQKMALGLKAYPGGNDFLYSLNTMRGADQHRLIIPIGTQSGGRTIVGGQFRGGGIVIGGSRKWASLENGMELLRTSGRTKVEQEPQFKLAVNVAFGDLQGVQGREVVTTLHQLRDLVVDIIERFEARFFR